MTRNIAHIISEERFSTYQTLTLGTPYSAAKLYDYNVALSETFYTPLHILEIALRNRVDTILTEKHDEYWFENNHIIMELKQQKAIQETLKKLQYKRNATPRGKVIAELSFGFWTAMFNYKYGKLWQSSLNKVARTKKGKGVKQTVYSKRITQARTLRNRIAHYEPIIPLHIKHQYDNIMTLIEWISPDAMEWLEQQSRFYHIYDAHIDDIVRLS